METSRQTKSALYKPFANPKTVVPAIRTLTVWADGGAILLTVLLGILRDVGSIQAFLHQSSITERQRLQPGSRFIHINQRHLLKTWSMLNFPLDDLQPSPLDTQKKFRHARVKQGKGANLITQQAIRQNMPPQSLDAC
jgi:hypothetical protein